MFSYMAHLKSMMYVAILNFRKHGSHENAFFLIISEHFGFLVKSHKCRLHYVILLGDRHHRNGYCQWGLVVMYNR